MPRPVSEMQRLYRNVFSSEEGREVLFDILAKGHFATTLDPDNRTQVAEYNVALTIAQMAGVFDKISPQFSITKEQ